MGTKVSKKCHEYYAKIETNGQKLIKFNSDLRKTNKNTDGIKDALKNYLFNEFEYGIVINLILNYMIKSMVYEYNDAIDSGLVKNLDELDANKNTIDHIISRINDIDAAISLSLYDKSKSKSKADHLHKRLPNIDYSDISPEVLNLIGFLYYELCKHAKAIDTAYNAIYPAHKEMITRNEEITSNEITNYNELYKDFLNNFIKPIWYSILKNKLLIIKSSSSDTKSLKYIFTLIHAELYRSVDDTNVLASTYDIHLTKVAIDYKRFTDDACYTSSGVVYTVGFVGGSEKDNYTFLLIAVLLLIIYFVIEKPVVLVVLFVVAVLYFMNNNKTCW